MNFGQEITDLNLLVSFSLRPAVHSIENLTLNWTNPQPDRHWPKPNSIHDWIVSHWCNGVHICRFVFRFILSISILVSTTVPHSNTARCSFIHNQFKKKVTRRAHTHTCEWIQHKHFLHLSRQIHIENVCLHLLVLGRLLHKQGKWSVS